MEKQGVSNIAVKRLNMRVVFLHLMERGSASVRDISSALSMSAPTVIQNLNELTDRNLVIVEGMQESTGGRKARAYGVNERACFAAGLDVTRSDASLTILGLRGQTVLNAKSRLPFSDRPEYYEKLGRFLSDHLEKADIRPEELVGVGLSLPAIIAGDGQSTTNADPLGKRIVQLDSFKRCIPWPCRLINDANAGGYAEFWAGNPIGRGHGPRNLVYLSVSNTVGGAVLIDGRMFEGDEQHSAEFGHMTLEPGGKFCYCGQKGCAYCYVNTRILSDAGGTLEAFFRQLKKGEANARAVWDKYLGSLALLINNIRCAYDCEVVVGGYLGRFLPPYLEELCARTAMRNIFERSGQYVRACAQKGAGAAMGAALVCLHNFIEEI
jgi:predicted NBD/HSP70 family sugar kinase